MKNLNALEITVIQSILDENKSKYPFLNLHIPYLYVKNREYTGVGIYSNFEYTKEMNTEDISDLISSGKTLSIEGLEYELAYILDITNGKINFLEIVTNGNEIWDGTFTNFILE